MTLIGLIGTDFYQRIKQIKRKFRLRDFKEHRATGAILWIPAQAVTNDSRTGNSVISVGSA